MAVFLLSQLQKWQKEFKKTASEEAVQFSLPHRGPGEQKQISSSFLGGTTWQEVCNQLEIPRSVLLNECV